MGSIDEGVWLESSSYRSIKKDWKRIAEEYSSSYRSIKKDWEKIAEEYSSSYRSIKKDWEKIAYEYMCRYGVEIDDSGFEKKESIPDRVQENPEKNKFLDYFL